MQVRIACLYACCVVRLTHGLWMSAVIVFLGDGFEIAVENPEDIANMDQDALKQKYDAAEAAKSGKKDDFSDMVAEHTNKANKKRKANKSKDDKQNKKFKNVF